MSGELQIVTEPGVGYSVLIGGAEAHARIAGLLAGRDVLVVSDDHVAPHHLDTFMAGLGGAARRQTLVLPAGEATKTLAGFERILDRLIEERFHRDAVLLALGGGVIGDMGGFAAACYQRGIDWIAVPTTLLAQVDAALGGKTAVNHPRGKNLIGAFHDPLAVWADPAFLDTLPPREYRAGLAEVVKYGLGLDAGFFEWLEQAADALSRRERDAVTEAVVRSAGFKLAVVAADRKEHGRRALLNLGHTVGHALETALGHGRWLHGEAVSAGLVAAAELSAARGALEATKVGRLRVLLQRLDLPVALPADVRVSDLRAALQLDKKIAAGRLRFIGLRSVGAAEIWNDVRGDEIEAVIAGLRTRTD